MTLTTVLPRKVIDLEEYIVTGIAYSNFTDGGGAAGTYQILHELPANFLINRCFLKNVTGFTGDTSAVITVGDGSDVDRLNAGTPSVFTTATTIDLGIPSGTVLVGTAFKPTITVTSNADFTSVAAGSMDLHITGYIL